MIVRHCVFSGMGFHSNRSTKDSNGITKYYLPFDSHQWPDGSVARGSWLMGKDYGAREGKPHAKTSALSTDFLRPRFTPGQHYVLEMMTSLPGRIHK